MATRMVITGHGAYASGTKSTVELIAGSNDRVRYIDFPAGESSEALKEELATALGQGSEHQIVFVCDLLGGTPFKMAVELSLERDCVEVIAGCNIGAIVEGSLLLPYHSAFEVATSMKAATIKSVAHFVVSSEPLMNTAALEDGI